MMQELVGIVRLQKEMELALDGIQQTQGRAPRKSPCRAIANTIPAGTPRIDFKHLLTVSEAITMSALDRKESRGGHFREDFPDKDPRSAEI